MTGEHLRKAAAPAAKAETLAEWAARILPADYLPLKAPQELAPGALPEDPIVLSANELSGRT